MPAPTVSITWTYTSDPLALAALGGFNVYALGSDNKRLAPAVTVAKSAPFAATLSVPGYAGQTVEVVPFDQQGTESTNKRDGAVYIQLPAVASLSQVVG
jgi:hypothetical protein